jgi:hypothetical protein
VWAAGGDGETQWARVRVLVSGNVAFRFLLVGGFVGLCC